MKSIINNCTSFSEADLGLLQHPRWSINYNHKVLHPECCSSPKSASDFLLPLVYGQLRVKSVLSQLHLNKT